MSSVANSSAFYGCWGSSPDAVSACCRIFGGTQANLSDSSTLGCTYNVGTRFQPDNGSATATRWATCVSGHSNDTSIVAACENAQNTPVSLSTTGRGSRVRLGWLILVILLFTHLFVLGFE
uniref:SRCR domain-containing protein n=1 Tax=Mycena chlorophos TaxID=658473 RepID=A0ABQ0M6K6_MYCCL|nr:predicted protein [Mycena chlorophos]